MLWAFDKAREHNLHPGDFAKDAEDENFFLELARRATFQHDLKVDTLPRKVTMEQSKYGWFVIHKHTPREPGLESAHNLFLKATSLIS